MRKFFPPMPLKDDLPKTSHDTLAIGLRSRISSFSGRIPPLPSSSAAWAFRRSRSMPSFTDLAPTPLRRCWDWLLSRKPSFARDIEMNAEETTALGCHCRGSWRHVLHRVRSELWRLVGAESTLPMKQEFRYEAFGYAQ